MVRHFLLNPKLDYSTFGNPKEKRKFIVFLYKMYKEQAQFNIPRLEMNAHLVSTIHTSNNIISDVGINSPLVDTHKRLVAYLVKYLLKYFSAKRVIKKGGISPKISVFGMSPFWINKENELSIRKKYIHLLTTDEKRVISSIYGEAIVRLILESSSKLPSAGVLKIDSSKKSTPDFIVLTRELRIAMVAEVKTSIDKNKADTQSQKRDFIKRHPKEKIRGLGINVKFNYKNEGKAIDIEVQDPTYTIEGNLVSSIIWRLALIESLLKVREYIVFELNDLNWANNLLDEYKEYILKKKHTIKEINYHKFSENKLFFKTKMFNSIVQNLLNPPRISEKMDIDITHQKEKTDDESPLKNKMDEFKLKETVFKDQLEYLNQQLLSDDIHIRNLNN